MEPVKLSVVRIADEKAIQKLLGRRGNLEVFQQKSEFVERVHCVIQRPRGFEERNEPFAPREDRPNARLSKSRGSCSFSCAYEKNHRPESPRSLSRLAPLRRRRG